MTRLDPLSNLRFSKFWLIFHFSDFFLTYFSYVFWIGLLNYRNISDIFFFFFWVFIFTSFYLVNVDDDALLWTYDGSYITQTRPVLQAWQGWPSWILFPSSLPGLLWSSSLNSLHLLPSSFIAFSHTCPLKPYGASQVVATWSIFPPQLIRLWNMKCHCGKWKKDFSFSWDRGVLILSIWKFLTANIFTFHFFPLFLRFTSASPVCLYCVCLLSFSTFSFLTHSMSSIVIKNAHSGPTFHELESQHY